VEVWLSKAQEELILLFDRLEEVILIIKILSFMTCGHIKVFRGLKNTFKKEQTETSERHLLKNKNWAYRKIKYEIDKRAGPRGVHWSRTMFLTVIWKPASEENKTKKVYEIQQVKKIYMINNPHLPPVQKSWCK